MRVHTVVDLFAGVGGLSYPFHSDSGFNVIVGNEILEEPAVAYGLNHPGTKVYNSDIADFSMSLVQADLGTKSVDVVLGGPPCQSFTTVGKRDINDPRTNLFKEYCRVLEESSARMFIFENVRGLLSMKGGLLFDEILQAFEGLGYKVQHKILDAVDYGVPQYRKRVIIVGTKSGIDFKFPEPTHGPGKIPYLTVEDAISDLPPLGTSGECESYDSPPQSQYQTLMRSEVTSLTNHNYSKNHDGLVRIMKQLPDGGSPRDLPEDIRPKSGFGNTYCRLWWDRPCTTITRNLGTPSSSRCIHPKEPRALTTREGARLQSFPDNFVFYGSRQKKNLQIGEAVPPMMAQALYAEVRASLGLIDGNAFLPLSATRKKHVALAKISA